MQHEIRLIASIGIDELRQHLDRVVEKRLDAVEKRGPPR